MDQFTFPHSDVEVQDLSAGTLPNVQIDPLHVPVFFGFAPKGDFGTPVYGSGPELSAAYSPEIFNTGTALANCHQMQFFRKAASLQRVYFVRLPDGSQVLGFSVIVLARSLTVPVYAKDPTTGAFQTGTTNGVTSYTIAQQNGTNQTQTATAYSTVTTPLVVDPTTGNLLPNDAAIRKQFSLAATDTWYEIVRITGRTPGNYTSRSAIQLSVTPAVAATDIQSRINMPLVRLTPLFSSDAKFNLSQQLAGTRQFTYNPVQNEYGQAYTDLVLNATSVVDPSTGVDLGWKNAIASSYNVSSAGSDLDYDIFVNTDGGLTATGVSTTAIQGILALAARMATESGRYPSPVIPTDFTNGQAIQTFLNTVQSINVLNGQDLNGNNLLNVPLDTNLVTGAQPFGAYSVYNGFNPALLTQQIAHNDQNLDAALQTFLNSSTSSNLNNKSRYNFTHVYDSAFSYQTKLALLTILGRRDGTAVDLVCDDFSTPVASATTSILAPSRPTRVSLSQAAALSVLSSLVTQARLYPDSSVYNTQTYRCEIFPQSGMVNVDGTLVLLPSSYKRMIDRCTYYNTPSVTGTPKGRPYSEATMFSSVNWVPDTDNQMQAFWSKCGNYMAWADRNTLYFPDYRTVYNNETSLLSSGTYKDYICFVKQIIHRRWTYYSGQELPAKSITKYLADDISSDTQTALGTWMTTATTVTAVADNSATGYTIQANTKCYGNMPDRVLEAVVTALRADTGTTTSNG